jgi:hypothetical protein
MPTSLEQLLAYMQNETPFAPASAAWMAAGLPVHRDGGAAFGLVPTYGGVEPEWAEEIWGWDECHLLVGFCRQTLEIIPRGSFDDWLANWTWPAELLPDHMLG